MEITVIRKSRATRMLSVAKADRVQRQVHVCLDNQADVNIASARARYREMLGRDVSTSLVVRRAVDLLARFLEGVDSDERVKDELSVIAKALR